MVVARSHVKGSQTLAVNQSNSTNGGIFRCEELNYVQRPLRARLVECSNPVTSLNQSKIEKGMNSKESVNQSFRESAKVLFNLSMNQSIKTNLPIDQLIITS